MHLLDEARPAAQCEGVRALQQRRHQLRPLQQQRQVHGVLREQLQGPWQAVVGDAPPGCPDGAWAPFSQAREPHDARVEVCQPARGQAREEQQSIRQGHQAFGPFAHASMQLGWQFVAFEGSACEACNWARL